MSDFVTAWLRTVVPGIWSAIVTALLGWLATSAPWFLSVLDSLHIDLTSPGTATVVMGVVLALWYAVWRRIEPHVPDWLSRIAMGSAKTPTYATPAFPVPAYATSEQVVLADGAIVTISDVILDLGADSASYGVRYPSGAHGMVVESQISRSVRGPE